MSRVLFAVLSVFLLDVAVLRAEPTPSTGAVGTLTLEGDDLSSYDIIPRKSEMTFTVEGPGVLFLYLVNHRIERRKGQSRVQTTLDGEPERVVTLNCPRVEGRFADQKRLLPCERKTVDLVIPEGEHVVGLQLVKTKWAASVHAIFTPSTPPELESDPDEPALVATPGGEDAKSVATEPTPEPEPALALAPPPAPPPLAQEPELVAEPGGDEAEVLATPDGPLELVPVEVEPEAELVASSRQSYGEALLEPLPLILLGAGAALGGASLYFGLEMNRDFSAYNDPDSPRPQVELPALEASGKDNRILMLAFGGAAVVTAGAALIVAATSGADAPGSDATASAFTAGCGADACGAAFTWSWP